MNHDLKISVFKKDILVLIEIDQIEEDNILIVGKMV